MLSGRWDLAGLRGRWRYLRHLWRVCKKPVQLLHLFRGVAQKLELTNGIVLEIDNWMDLWIVAEVYGEDVYELRAPVSGVVVDVGANMGDFAIGMAHAHPQVRVLAIEPAKATYERLVRNVKLNRMDKKVLPLRLAVGEREGKVVLETQGPSFGWKVGLQAEDDSQTEWVKQVTLMGLLKQQGVDNVGRLKVDCEGAEWGIFKGLSKKDLQTFKRIDLEYHLFSAEADVEGLVQQLERAGFEVENRLDLIASDVGTLTAMRK